MQRAAARPIHHQTGSPTPPSCVLQVAGKLDPDIMSRFIIFVRQQQAQQKAAGSTIGDAGGANMDLLGCDTHSDSSVLAAWSPLHANRAAFCPILVKPLAKQLHRLLNPPQCRGASNPGPSNPGPRVTPNSFFGANTHLRGVPARATINVLFPRLLCANTQLRGVPAQAAHGAAAAPGGAVGATEQFSSVTGRQPYGCVSRLGAGCLLV